MRDLYHHSLIHHVQVHIMSYGLQSTCEGY